MNQHAKIDQGKNVGSYDPVFSHPVWLGSYSEIWTKEGCNPKIINLGSYSVNQASQPIFFSQVHWIAKSIGQPSIPTS